MFEIEISSYAINSMHLMQDHVKNTVDEHLCYTKSSANPHPYIYLSIYAAKD